MEVHHHSHTNRKKFKHYLWEFFMLFLAVTLGFLVDNMREHFVEHNRAKEFAQMLKYDLMKDTSLLNNFNRGWSEESSRRDFAKNLYNKPISEITIGDLRKKDTTSFLLSLFIPNNATFEQMKSSGELRYFKNIELISRLASYDWSIKNYLELKHEMENTYGGITNEHTLQYDIKMEEFLKKSNNLDSAVFAANAGYKFDSWLENKKIMENLLLMKELFSQGIYPDLKSQAASIIDILNKEYHLK